MRNKYYRDANVAQGVSTVVMLWFAVNVGLAWSIARMSMWHTFASGTFAWQVVVAVAGLLVFNGGLFIKLCFLANSEDVFGQVGVKAFMRRVFNGDLRGKIAYYILRVLLISNVVMAASLFALEDARLCSMLGLAVGISINDVWGRGRKSDGLDKISG